MKILNNHIVYNPLPHEDIKWYPEAKQAVVGTDTFFAVPCNYQYSQVLRNVGHKDVPDTILYEYSWPGSFKPYAHQSHTAAFLTRHRRAFLLSDMGTGKTMSTLWAADYLMSIGVIKKVLIVAPLSTLERVWGDEIFKHLWHRSFTVLYGSSDKRRELLKRESDFYIINPDGVNILADELSKRKDINLMIIDELASYRNRTTNRWKVMNKLLTQDKWVWGLTGTPTPNEPPEAFAQAKLLNPEKCMYTYREFRFKTMNQVTQYKWVIRPGAEQFVNAILSPSIRYTLDECIDLPECIFHDRQVQLSESQIRVIKQLEHMALSEVGSKTITAVNAAVLINKVVQAACGIVYAQNGEIAKLDFDARYNVLEECIEEAKGKVIVFVPYTVMIDHIHSRLNKKWPSAVIDGGVSPHKRNQIFKDFQDGSEPHIIVANPAAMSHGLTLTAADTIIWYAPIHSGEIYPQANARVRRPGQKKVSNIIHISATPTERKIYDALKNKKSFQEMVLDLVKNT